MTFVNNNAQEKYEKKYNISKECGNLINNFLEKNKSQLVMGTYYIKINELYAILELCENFDAIFEYLTQRFNAIKEIHEQSSEFTVLIGNIDKELKNCEAKYTKLLNLYNETFQAFEEYEKLVNEISLFDKEIKEKFMI